jgi:hypothetical protein
MSVLWRQMGRNERRLIFVRPLPRAGVSRMAPNTELMSYDLCPGGRRCGTSAGGFEVDRNLGRRIVHAAVSVS